MESVGDSFNSFIHESQAHYDRNNAKIIHFYIFYFIRTVFNFSVWIEYNKIGVNGQKGFIAGNRIE